MAHIRSKDPFEFVGKHVVRGLPRAPHRQEHGWITRYDSEVDCYWLFVPGAGPPRRVPRTEVIKFVANPNIEMRDGDDDAYPPPVEDLTSRFVGVPVLKRAGTSRRRWKAPRVAGKVVCFLPFADLYRVQFDDGTTEEMEETAIVDSLIEQVKAPAADRDQKSAIDVDALSAQSGGRKRPRASSDPSSSPEFEEVLEPPPASSRSSSVAPWSAAAIPTSNTASATDGRGLDDSNAYEVEEDEEAILEYTAPLPASTERVSILELDEAESELIPVDEDIQVVADSAGRQAGFSILEEVEPRELPSSPRSPSAMSFYIIEDAVHTAINPLDRRSDAFEYLRLWLLNLLDRQEAGSRKNLQQYDVLRNTDIKDRDAIRRFIEADGLCVLNDLVAAFMNTDTDEGDEDLLFVLKVVAMLPLPTFDQVMQAKLGRTIKSVIKLSKERQRPFPMCISQLAKWIKSRWEVNIKVPEKQPKPAPRPHTARPSRPMQKRRIYAPVASAIPRGPSLMLAGTPAQNRMPTGETHAVNNPTPIPRLPRRAPPPAIPVVESPAPPPPVSSFAESRASTASQAQPPSAQQPQPTRRGSLKPDWMRQSEQLSLTRFTAQSDSTAERRHYQAHQATPTAGTEQKKNEEQPASAGGPSGVYGRRQRLKFGKKWAVQQYDVSEPPTTVSRDRQRLASRGYWSSSSVNEPPFQRFPSSSSSFGSTPRPILRRDSKYNSELNF